LAASQEGLNSNDSIVQKHYISFSTKHLNVNLKSLLQQNINSIEIIVDDRMVNKHEASGGIRLGRGH
jgi:hypothetical protein